MVRGEYGPLYLGRERCRSFRLDKVYEIESENMTTFLVLGGRNTDCGIECDCPRVYYSLLNEGIRLM